MTNALLAQLGGMEALDSASYMTRAGCYVQDLESKYWHEEEGELGTRGPPGAEQQQDAPGAARVKRLMGKALDFLMLSDSMLFSGMATGFEAPPLPLSPGHSGACVHACVGGPGAVGVLREGGGGCKGWARLRWTDRGV